MDQTIEVEDIFCFILFTCRLGLSNQLLDMSSIKGNSKNRITLCHNNI